jgi:DNA-binding response OmpR family regulator
MGHRVLTVGIDMGLLSTRQALLASRGYDPVIATPNDVDEKLNSGTFDLVVLSVMLSQEDKRLIQAKLPAGTRVLALQTLAWPRELLQMVAETLAPIEHPLSGS